MFRSRPVLIPLAIAMSLAACSGGAASPAGGAPTGPAATSPAAATTLDATDAPAATQAGGAPGAYCSLFTTDAIQAFLGSAVSAGQSDPAKPDNCSWATSDGTTVTIHKADEIVCESERVGVMGKGGGTFDGDSYFAGAMTTGEAVGAYQTSNFCYSVLVNPATKAPKADALLAFVKQFVQAVGA